MFRFFFLIPKNLSGERLEGNPARTQLHSSVCTNDFLPFSASTACPAPATQSKRFLGLSATTSAPNPKVKHTFQRYPTARKESEPEETYKTRKTFQKTYLVLWVTPREKGNGKGLWTKRQQNLNVWFEEKRFEVSDKILKIKNRLCFSKLNIISYYKKYFYGDWVSFIFYKMIPPCLRGYNSKYKKHYAILLFVIQHVYQLLSHHEAILIAGTIKSSVSY